MGVANDDIRLLGLLAFNRGMVPYYKMTTNERQAWRQVKGGEVFGGFPGSSLPAPEAGPVI